MRKNIAALAQYGIIDTTLDGESPLEEYHISDKRKGDFREDFWNIIGSCMPKVLRLQLIFKCRIALATSGPSTKLGFRPDSLIFRGISAASFAPKCGLEFIGKG